MRKTFQAGFMVLGLAIAIGALAAGSGGGGSLPPEPTCSADSWTCSEWTACSASGEQVRTCTLSFDCPSTSTPKPSESQPCIPPRAPEAPPAVPEPEPKPIPPASQCIAMWECKEWSACNAGGKQTRECGPRDPRCVPQRDPRPETERACPTLQCGDKATLRERVSCRLGLSYSGIERELALEYLPEECRAMPPGANRNACIARYRSFEPCWEIPVGETRFACARTVLKINRPILDEVQTCEARVSAERASCKEAVRENVYAMVKFRIYDLAERAEELIERGVDKELVADFVALAESKKQEFNAAKTIEERRRIILDVRTAWKDFIAKAKTQL